MNAVCRTLHNGSSSNLHWALTLALCENQDVDFRDRIRLALGNSKESMRQASLRAGSDSLIHKVLNPDKRGGIKWPTIDKMEGIARALKVSPGWLAYGEKTEISAEVLSEAVDTAAEEIQAGMNIAQIRQAVASALREQLELHLAVGAGQGTSDGASAPDKLAQSRAPTSEDAPEESRIS